MTINECNTLEQLFILWEKESDKKFYKDGYIDEDNYGKGTYKEKVLFIAKECHIGNNNSDQNLFWVSDTVKKIVNNQEKNAGRIAFLEGMAMLYNDMLYDSDPDKNNPNKTLDCLLGAAFMNLNKCGGSDKCDHENLKKYVDEYKEYIRKEIDIINPDIIICCGPYVMTLIDHYELAINRKVVAAYHPSYRRSDKAKRDYFKKNLS